MPFEHKLVSVKHKGSLREVLRKGLMSMRAHCRDTREVLGNYIVRYTMAQGRAGEVLGKC